MVNLNGSHCNVCINQRDAQILVNNLYFYFFVKWLYMFRILISPSSGATFNLLVTDFFFQILAHPVFKCNTETKQGSIMK